MNQDNVSKFIKEIRKKNNLTQKDLADKYNVTYQAVSKWENGINMPEITLLRQMSKDFNISLDDILDGSKSKKSSIFLYIIVTVVIIIIGTIIVVKLPKQETFNFKTLSTTCQEFEVKGSIAYDKNKSSIYISHIDYCGGNDTKTYDRIECNLYEKNGDVNIMINKCIAGSDATLESYLRNTEIKIDNYSQTCKNYDDGSLYLEISAIKDDVTTTYKIPLDLNDKCEK